MPDLSGLFERVITAAKDVAGLPSSEKGMSPEQRKSKRKKKYGDEAKLRARYARYRQGEIDKGKAETTLMRFTEWKEKYLSGGSDLKQ